MPQEKRDLNERLEDFVCGKCGKVARRVERNYAHIACDESLPVVWVDERRETCWGCEHKKRDQDRGEWVCGIERDTKPDCFGSIEFGIRIAEFECKKMNWLRVATRCPECKARNFHGEKPFHFCSFCSYETPDPQQDPIDDLVAVTSLSLLPQHTKIQNRVIASWLAFGLQVHVVTHVSETQQIRELYSHHELIWHETPYATEGGFERTTPKITSLTDVAAELNRTVMVINSDIEIHGNQEDLLCRLRDETLVGGIRQNFRHHWSDGQREQWGIDAFVLTPEMAGQIPRLGFGIGAPVWDYWLPLHFRQTGYEIDLIGEPLFYHRVHPIHWSQNDWELGARFLSDYYGPDCIDFPDGQHFRKSLPFPPGS